MLKRKKKDIQGTQSLRTSLFDLLRLQLDSLPIHKNTLPLIRLRFPPPPNLGREHVNDFPLHPFQKDPCGLWRTSSHPHRHPQLDGMRVSNLQRDKLLSRVFRLHGRRSVLYRCSVTDAD